MNLSLYTLWNNYLVYIVDLTIVVFIFYKFLIFIRGSKAINIFWGLLLIAIFTLIVVKLNLPITSWLLKQFWVAGIIILAIVFQPELRSVLSEIALLKKNFIPPVVVEEIISAVKTLAENKYGALIVVEKNIGLKDFTKTGVIINADVSKELLISIFYPKNPLHDGAVIISKNKIISAKCILPLSEEKYCAHLGTRHRAAAGIAEHTDAIVIAVSEERGSITIAFNKNFYYDITPQQLRDLLYQKIKHI
ncbi:MAG: diadenylate cyclase CdaA [Endomicrobia bacterium]|nr:diadenylate cyclase CdaA [Endomicrobiia bacterium]MCX7715865.1 diadenylate cyclase CdaA [Endomicrobiia bacterium]